MSKLILNVATLLSLLGSVIALCAWTRSLFVTEAWDFAPAAQESSLKPTDSGGWFRYRIVESTGGRLVWIQYDAVNTPTRPDLWARQWLLAPPTFGYHTGQPFSPGQSSRNNPKDVLVPPGTIHGRIPLLAEWYVIPYRNAQRYFAVSWCLIVVAGAFLPCVRIWRYWKQFRPRRAFSVVSARHEASQPNSEERGKNNEVLPLKTTPHPSASPPSPSGPS